MRVALYVTCLVDLMRPSVAFASLRLLEAAGCEVIVPEGQTCCGQPAWSAGERALAADLARKAIGELEGYDYVVIPSGSCADQIRNVYPQLLADDPAWGLRARTLLREPFMACLPTLHALARQARVAVSDLSQERMVLFAESVSPEYFRSIRTLCQRAGFDPEDYEAPEYGQAEAWREALVKAGVRNRRLEVGSAPTDGLHLELIP